MSETAATPPPAAVSSPAATQAAASAAQSAVEKWGAPSISVYSLTIFLAAIIIAYFKANDTLLTALLGVAATNATSVVQFWVGSSSGSQKKDDTIAAQSIQGTKA